MEVLLYVPSSAMPHVLVLHTLSAFDPSTYTSSCTTDFASHHFSMENRPVEFQHGSIDLGSFLLDIELYQERGYRFTHEFGADWELLNKLLQEVGQEELRPHVLHSTLQLHQRRKLPGS